MDPDTQISAYIPRRTKDRLDLYVRETGVTKGRAVADALEAYLDAHDELPSEAVIPTHIVLDRESGERFLELLADESEPPEALVELMRMHKERS